MKKNFEFLIRLIYPEICFNCQKSLTFDERCLCSPCQKTFNDTLIHLSKCQSNAKSEYLRYQWTLSSYEGITKKMIKAFKFDKRADLLTPFKQPLENLYSALRGEVYHDMFIPVPSTSLKRAIRFYCSCEEISDFLAKKFKIQNRSDLIHKKWGVPSQRNLRKEERLANLYGAFKICHSEQIKNKNILIIDDVSTTGTTVQEIARVLVKNGAASVDCLTLAKTIESKAEKIH